MNKLKLQFGLLEGILLVTLLVELALVMLNRNALNVWTYFLWWGILPIILLALLTATLTRHHQFTSKLMSNALITFVGVVVIIILTHFIDVNQIVSQTDTSGADFSMNLEVDKNAFADLITTFITTYFLSIFISLFFGLSAAQKGGDYNEGFSK